MAQVYLINVRKAINNHRVHAHHKYYVVWGRKPDTAIDASTDTAMLAAQNGDSVQPREDLVHPREGLAHPREGLVHPRENFFQAREDLVQAREDSTVSKEYGYHVGQPSTLVLSTAPAYNSEPQTQPSCR